LILAAFLDQRRRKRQNPKALKVLIPQHINGPRAQVREGDHICYTCPYYTLRLI